MRRQHIALVSIAALLAFALAVPERTQQRPQEKTYVAKKDGEKVIGSLKYQIIETATSKVLTKGDREIKLKDVTIAKRIGEDGPMDLTMKRISLGAHFVLEMAEFPSDSSHVTGFGLTGDRDDQRTFSWEWFTVDEPDHATKLQETGELGITITKVGPGWEVTRTEFLTDISIRIKDYGDLSGDVQGFVDRPPEWRIKIFKGSVIYWPSLVDGKVVPNGTLTN